MNSGSIESRFRWVINKTSKRGLEAGGSPPLSSCLEASVFLQSVRPPDRYKQNNPQVHLWYFQKWRKKRNKWRFEILEFEYVAYQQPKDSAHAGDQDRAAQKA